MTKAGVLVGTVGGVIAICGTIVAVSQYFERLSGRISQLEEQVRSMALTATMADHLNGRVSQLEEQMRSLTASSGATAVANVRLDGRISQLEEEVHALAASSATTAAAITEMSKKFATTVDPILQKCVELAEEVNTGQRNHEMGFSAGPEVTRNAAMSMEKLGCSSMRH